MPTSRLQATYHYIVGKNWWKHWFSSNVLKEKWQIRIGGGCIGNVFTKYWDMNIRWAYRTASLRLRLGFDCTSGDCDWFLFSLRISQNSCIFKRRLSSLLPSHCCMIVGGKIVRRYDKILTLDKSFNQWQLTEALLKLRFRRFGFLFSLTISQHSGSTFKPRPSSFLLSHSCSCKQMYISSGFSWVYSSNQEIFVSESVQTLMTQLTHNFPHLRVNKQKIM
jgi:hypothetical protein